MADNDSLISQFKDVTGAAEENARFFLESANWSLEDAISSFYENQAEVPNVVEIEDNEVAVESGIHDLVAPTRQLDAEMEGTKTSKGSSFVGSKASQKPKVATLNTLAHESSDEEEGQTFYAGGSDRSGQQIVGSPKRKNYHEQLMNMFKAAQEQGSMSDMPSTSSQSSWGVGLRLGQTEDEPPTVVGSKPAESNNTIKTVVLKLWSRGFSIDDGELRPYDDAQNKLFLATVMRGEIPDELRKMGNQVGVNVEDHRHEDFQKPTAGVVKTFNGAGHTLGSPAPNVQETQPMESSASPDESKENEAQAAQQVNLDANAPATSVQVRLADGSRIAARFNLSHTIDDIRQYIVRARPQYANRNFILVTSFPTKELSDGTSTIESAALQNAVIMQRLK